MYKKIATIVTVVAIILGSIPVMGGDSKIGEKKAKMCVACHGKMGLSKRDDVPSLAGQGEVYLVKAMNDFKNRIRSNAQMSMVAETLTEEDIKHLAAYFSSFKVVIE